jgi:prepilin-type N-terminal cleavage/methylation domain-containing protein
MNLKTGKGYTVLELMITIALMGVLVALVLPEIRKLKETNIEQMEGEFLCDGP